MERTLTSKDGVSGASGAGDAAGAEGEASRSRALVAELESFCSSYKLTPRESEIVGVLVEGVVRIKDIADRLKLSPNTINNHVNSIFGKTSARSKSQLLAMFLDRISTDLTWARLLRRRPHVLVASKDATMLKLFSETLGRRDVRVYSTPQCDLSTAEFQSVLAQAAPHFLVIDLDHCPSPEKLDLAAIRGAEGTMVLWVGSDGKRIERCQAMNSGAIDCLKKPIRSEDLEKILVLLIAHYAEDGGDRERYLGEDHVLAAKSEIRVEPKSAGRGGIFVDSTVLNDLFERPVSEGDWVDLRLRWETVPSPRSVRGQVAWADSSGAGVRLFQPERIQRQLWSDFIDRHSIRSYIPKV